MVDYLLCALIGLVPGVIASSRGERNGPLGHERDPLDVGADALDGRAVDRRGGASMRHRTLRLGRDPGDRRREMPAFVASALIGIAVVVVGCLAVIFVVLVIIEAKTEEAAPPTRGVAWAGETPPRFVRAGISG